MVLNSTKKYLLVFSALLLICGNTSFSSDNINSNDINKSEEYNYTSNNIIKGKTHLKNRRSRSVENKRTRHDNDMDNTLNRTFSQKGRNTFNFDDNVIDNQKNSMLNMTFAPKDNDEFNTYDNSKSANNETNLLNFTFAPKVNNEFDGQDDEYSNRKSSIKNIDVKSNMTIIERDGRIHYNPKSDLKLPKNYDDEYSNREAGVKKYKINNDLNKLVKKDEKGNFHFKGTNNIISPIRADIRKDDNKIYYKQNGLQFMTSDCYDKKYELTNSIVPIHYNNENNNDNLTEYGKEEPKSIKKYTQTILEKENNRIYKGYDDVTEDYKIKNGNNINKEEKSEDIAEHNFKQLEKSYGYNGSIFDYNKEDRKEDIKENEEDVSYHCNNGEIYTNIVSSNNEPLRNNTEVQFSSTNGFINNYHDNNVQEQYSTNNNNEVSYSYNAISNNNNDVQFSNNNSLISHNNNNITSISKDDKNNNELPYSDSASVYGNSDGHSEYLSYPGRTMGKK